MLFLLLFGVVVFAAYVPLRSEGQSGQSLIVTTDQLVIRCPVNGVPGPDLIYWQKGIDTNSSKLV